jgi:hypothetical protein
MSQKWENYNKVGPSGISQFQKMTAYLGGSVWQTVIDNPVTAYRQLVQQYAKDLTGNVVDPKIASQEAKAVFKKSPLSAATSGLGPRLIGVGFKRIPKFGFLLSIQYVFYGGGDVGMMAATGASILSAPFINPIRMIEKQQRAYFKTTGAQKPIVDILKESAAKNFKPLFRGTLPLMGHSLASATTGLVGQPQLRKWCEKKLKTSSNMSGFTIGLVSSAMVSPIYVAMTNPLSRLEVIMQTSKLTEKRITLVDACKEVVKDSKKFGLRGIFRGQGLGIAKAIVSLSMFHEGRLFLMRYFKSSNEASGRVYEGKKK